MKPVPTPGKMSVTRSIGWVAAGQGSYFALQFASSVILARLLTPYEVGVFALAFATMGMITILQAIGLNNYLIREQNLTEEISATVFSVNLVIAALLTATIGLFGLGGSVIFREVGVGRVLAWLSVIPLIQAIGFLPTALVERDGNFRLISIIRSASSLLGVGTTVTFALNGYSYMSFAYGQVLSALASTVMLVTFGSRHNSFKLSFNRWREIQTFAFHMLATSGVSRIGNRLQDVLLGKLLGLDSLGLYSRAGNIYNLIWDNIFVIVSRVVFVDLSTIARSGAPIGPRYSQCLSIITAIIWPAFGGLAILSSPFVQTVYGEKWLGVSIPLALLCLVGVIYTSVAMTWELFVLAGETGRQARIEFIRTATGLILVAGGCMISLTAATAARVLEAGFTVILYSPHVRRITGVTRRELLSIYGKAVILVVGAVAPSLCIMILYQWSPTAPIGVLSAGVASGLIIWLVMLWQMNHVLYQEVKGMVLRRNKLNERLC